LRTTLTALALAFSTASVTLRAAVSDICAKVRRRRGVTIFSPVPKWNKETDDIDGADFLRQSQEYERALLPGNLVFPRAGQIWEAQYNCEVPILKCAPYSGAQLLWDEARLRQGDRVCILTLDNSKPLFVRFQVIRSQKEHHNVQNPPEEIRMQMACIVPVAGQKAAYFSELFRLVVDAPES